MRLQADARRWHVSTAQHSASLALKIALRRSNAPLGLGQSSVRTHPCVSQLARAFYRRVQHCRSARAVRESHIVRDTRQARAMQQYHRVYIQKHVFCRIRGLSANGPGDVASCMPYGLANSRKPYVAGHALIYQSVCSISAATHQVQLSFYVHMQTRETV